MSKKMEIPFLPGLGPKRTEKELVESIRKKRSSGERLDKEEQELVDKQTEEDEAERNAMYGR